MLLWAAAGLTLVIVALGAVVASRSVARTQALDDSERMTTRLANLVVAPLLAGALAGNVDDRRELDRGITNRMSDGYLTEVTVWSAEGEVLYADNPANIGLRVTPPAEVVAALEGKVTSAFEDAPEVPDRDAGADSQGYVEVYVPFDLPNRPRMAFEAYYDYARVNEVADSLLWKIIPLALVPLLALQFFQVPIAVSLARRVRRHEAERSLLLERTLSVSKKERIQIAADLHDGPIQDLAGIGYALGAMSPSIAANHQSLMTMVQSRVMHAIESLRRLMIELYPPDLSSAQLGATLDDLADPLREKGVEVDVQIGQLPELSEDIVTTLYRVSRESLGNILQHAEASQVTISLDIGEDSLSGRESALLRIVDNGVGINLDRLDRRAEGHLGLRLLIDRVESLGGSMAVAPGPQGGTTVHVVVPLTDSMTAPPIRKSSRSGRSKALV